MDITELLSSNLGKEIISGIGKQTGTNEKETATVLSAAAPALLGMLQKNATSAQGANGILGALDKHDGSILNNISGYLGLGDTKDGGGILGHILGDNQNAFESAISTKTGVASSKVSNILMMFAPILMGFLGKNSHSTNTTSSSGLGGLLGNMIGKSGSSDILSSILGGSSGSGSVLGDVVSGALDGAQKKGGLGGLLGGFFGKK